MKKIISFTLLLCVTHYSYSQYDTNSLGYGLYDQDNKQKDAESSYTGDNNKMGKGYLWTEYNGSSTNGPRDSKDLIWNTDMYDVSRFRKNNNYNIQNSSTRTTSRSSSRGDIHRQNNDKKREYNARNDALRAQRAEELREQMEENRRREEERKRRIEEENRRDRERGLQEYYMRTAGYHQANAMRDEWMRTEGVRRLKEDYRAIDMADIPEQVASPSSQQKMDVMSGKDMANLLRGKNRKGNISYGLDPNATIAINEWHSDDLKWINPDKIKPVPSSYAEVKAWNKLRESCSENKLLMLAHSLRTLNGGVIPKFIGYNDGKLVMYSASSEFDDTQNEKLFVVSPDGGSIFYLETEKHNGKTENIFQKIEREEDLVDISGKISGLTLGASFKKNNDVTDENNISFKLGKNDYKIESKGEFKLSKTVPKGDVTGEIVLLDDSYTLSSKKVFINDYFSVEFGGNIKAGPKVSAEGKIYFDLDEKKAGVKFDAGVELIGFGANAQVSFIRNTNGNNCIVTTEVNAKAGVKPSIMTATKYFLNHSYDYDVTITPINDITKQIPNTVSVK